MQTITDIMTTNAFVSSIALDFSKAFDSVRHVCLAKQDDLAKIHDSIYNWLVDFFRAK